MLTLSQSTSEARTFLKVLIIFLGGLLSLIIIVKGVFALKDLIFPPKIPPPTVAFGLLPKVNFPSNATEKNLTYTIDTTSGSLPAFPDRITVNKMEGYPADLLGVDTANRMAGNLGFPTPGTSLSLVNYRWNDSSTLQRELTMNVVTKDFIMTSLFLNDPYVLGAAALGNQNNAVGTAQSFLQSMPDYPTDIDGSSINTNLFRIDNGALVPATSLSNTQIISVTFFQQNINDLPIYYPNALSSTMNILVGSGSYQPTVVGADFSHQYVSTTSATYPIKTASQAFDDLQKGKGFISYYGGGDNIHIKDVFLAYYVGEEKQKYIFPIIVFQGDGFYAYVPAIPDEWFEK